VIFPNQWGAQETYTQVQPNQMLLVPEPSKDPFLLTTQPPGGLTEVLVVASTTPLRKVLLALRQIATRGPVTLDTSNSPIDFINNRTYDSVTIGRRCVTPQVLFLRSDFFVASHTLQEKMWQLRKS
jgi:hypothetical protein